jgi:NNP family nitrate/nitrite transporter-like MFS transporter
VLADRLGGHRMLVLLLSGAALFLFALASLPPATVALTCLALGMGLLGMGNGSVFQLVPQRFAGRVGIMTGIIGAAGGLGGFLLPSVLGIVKQKTGSFGIGFALVSGAMLCGVASLLYLRNVWLRTWPAAAAMRAGLLPRTAKKVGVYAG